jgi:hypothetical protein
VGEKRRIWRLLQHFEARPECLEEGEKLRAALDREPGVRVEGQGVAGERLDQRRSVERAYRSVVGTDRLPGPRSACRLRRALLCLGKAPFLPRCSVAPNNVLPAGGRASKGQRRQTGRTAGSGL